MKNQSLPWVAFCVCSCLVCLGEGRVPLVLKNLASEAISDQEDHCYSASSLQLLLAVKRGCGQWYAARWGNEGSELARETQGPPAACIQELWSPLHYECLALSKLVHRTRPGWSHKVLNLTWKNGKWTAWDLVLPSGRNKVRPEKPRVIRGGSVKGRSSVGRGPAERPHPGASPWALLRFKGLQVGEGAGKPKNTENTPASAEVCAALSALPIG